MKKECKIIIDENGLMSFESDIKPIELLGVLRFYEKQVWYNLMQQQEQQQKKKQINKDEKNNKI